MAEAGFEVHLICPEGPQARRFCEDERVAFHPCALSRTLSPKEGIFADWGR